MPPPRIVDSSPPGPTLEEMIARVFEVSDLKPSSRRTYAYAIRDFIRWSAGHPVDQTILIRYKNYLRSRTELAPRTTNLYLAATRAVFHRLFALGILPFDASPTVRAFKIGSAHKRSPITDAQVTRAFRYASRRQDTQLVLILNLLYRQGLRQKEIVDLRIDHFDEQHATLSILGKGRDDRELIHLHPETSRTLRAYAATRRIKAGFLFPSPRSTERHMGTNALYKRLITVHRHCRIPNSPHGWRKVFTSKLIEAGMNLLDVQAFTRHASLEQLRVYFDRISFERALPAYYDAFVDQNEPSTRSK